jgi:kynurenine formamidase
VPPPPRDDHPFYRDLPRTADGRAAVAWDVFGPDDRVGTLNLLTPDRVREATALVRRGLVFPLNWSLQQPDPPMFGRRLLRHRLIHFANGMDDAYDDFYPQGSSQWDSLSHIGHPEYGFYGGRRLAEVTVGPDNPLGIEHWATRGIAGRFVLVDVARRRARLGRPLDHAVGEPIEPGELEATMADQGVELRGGDVLLIRFGWIDWYQQLDDAGRRRVAELGHTPTPGLAQHEAIAEWLWDRRVAAVVGDNPGVEMYPADPDDLERFLHYRLLPLLGFAIGELFFLDGLAADCAADGVFEGLFTAAPLNLAGGVGSPANALALK